MEKNVPEPLMTRYLLIEIRLHNICYLLSDGDQAFLKLIHAQRYKAPM